jgi:hypothetical protein
LLASAIALRHPEPPTEDEGPRKRHRELTANLGNGITGTFFAAKRGGDDRKWCGTPRDFYLAKRLIGPSRSVGGSG